MHKTFNNTLNSDINVTERGELRHKQKEDSDREQQAESDEEKHMQKNQKGMFDEEVNQRQQDKEASDLREEEEHE